MNDEIKDCGNKTIKSVEMVDDKLVIKFDDGYKLLISDQGQNCCEARWMSTDDDLTYFAGSKFVGYEVCAGQTIETEDNYNEHQVQFLIVATSLGEFTMVTHNEHNGYYGGFSIEASVIES